ncbi:MAG: CotH kinase family protein [Candidatus Aminicenantes bacterium]|jgi:hypothetical protein
MIIGKSEPKRFLGLPGKFWVIVFILFSLFLTALAGFIYLKKDDIIRELKNYVKDIRNSYVRQLICKYLAQPEEIFIEIKHLDFQKLVYKREQALDIGILIADSGDFVPAVIRCKDRTVKVKIRLKGDWVSGLQGDKWSFRIKVRGENTLFGMKQFSLHHPRERNYIYEWILHKAFKREEILALRYDFINVYLNGKELGIYAIEEHFEKRLIEHNRYREGPIIKFDEDILWRDRARGFTLGKEDETAYYSSAIDAFKLTRTLADPVLRKEFLHAVRLLEAFREKKLKVSQVFNIEKLATFYALADLNGADHLTVFHNLRFYYNSVTSKLEPIAFDGNAGNQISYLLEDVYLYRNNSFFNFNRDLFRDLEFVTIYHQNLERMSSKSYVDELLDSLADDTGRVLNILYSEFRGFIFYRDILYKNQEYIYQALHPVKGFHAYFKSFDNNYLVLQLGNIQPLPIEIIDITYNNRLHLTPLQTYILDGKNPRLPVSYREIKFKLPGKGQFNEALVQALKVNYRIPGTRTIRSERVFPWQYPGGEFPGEDLIRQTPNVSRFDFLYIKEKTKEILFKPGNWKLTGSLVIPAGYRVICRKGMCLDLLDSAIILSYSPVSFYGSEENPVTFYSSDGKGQGLVVIDAQKLSELRYVTFNNLSNPGQGNWELTGAVTFYQSPVEIENCLFENTRCEDGLNIIRSEFLINRTLFKDSYSDAFDCDFSQGKVSFSSFLQCGNDGIDASGSHMEMKCIVISGAGDKGLSVGENSRLNAEDIQIKSSEIAIASKDQSKILLHKGNISACKIGFTAYQKKPEYSFAEITASAVNMSRVDIPYLVEMSSTCIINGKAVTSDQDNIKKLMYGVKYGKSSN